MKSLKLAIDKLSHAESKSIRRLPKEAEKIEDLRKLYNQVLTTAVSVSRGQGKINATGKLIEAALGYRGRSSSVRRAVSRKSLSLAALKQGDFEKYTDVMLPEPRVLRKDRLTDEDLQNIQTGFDASSEVSPNMNDIVRKMLLAPEGGDSRFELHQRHYLFRTLREVQNEILSMCGKTYSLGTLSINKPFYISKGKINSCMCHRFYVVVEKSRSTFFMHRSRLNCL